MLTSPLFSALLKGSGTPRTRSLILQQGQVLRGEVLRILPHQAAVVQVGQMKLQAKLEAPLVAGQRSWFQVMSVQDPIILKIIPTPSANQPRGKETPVASIIRFLGLQQHTHNEEIIRFFLREKLPLNKHVLQQVQQLLSALGRPQQTLPAIQAALVRQWPLTEETVQAIRTFLFDPPLSGQQLFFNLETDASPFYQLLFQFYVQHGSRTDDFYGQMEGQKNSKGDIDPENCRMIFYVQLQYLGETCLDINIVDKRISVTIYNENKIQNWLAKLKPAVAEHLEQIGYTLTGLTLKDIQEMKQPFQHSSPYSAHSPLYQGVDIRI